SSSSIRMAYSASTDNGACTSNRPISVLCLISGLEYGGAEMMLYKLLSRMDRRKFTFHVISMIEPGPMSGRIRDLGVPLQSLGMRRGIPNPMGILRLIHWLRHTRPDVIQTWMYHADLVGGLAAKVVGNIPVAWNIRFSNFSANNSPQLSVYTMKMCAKLSRWLPARIVCCSESSRQVHIKLGYVADKMIVIPNGFNLDTFTPDP